MGFNRQENGFEPLAQVAQCKKVMNYEFESYIPFESAVVAVFRSELSGIKVPQVQLVFDIVVDLQVTRFCAFL